MRQLLGIILLVLAVAGAAWALLHHSLAAPTANAMRTITIGSAQFEVEVANTEALRELGLGERDSLAQNSGMLFVFDTPGSWGIWMKDMHFPIDILWARADGTIITIDRAVATSTYPNAFYPATADASYVVEVNAGALAGVAEGAKLMVQ